MTIEVDLDDRLIRGSEPDDASEIDFLYNRVLKEELILHSNLLAETLGPVTVLNVHQKKYGCHRGLGPADIPSPCVIDTYGKSHCEIASNGTDRDACPYWRPYFVE